MLRVYVLDFEGSWDVHLPLVEFSYNNSYHSSVSCASFEALYGRKYRSSIMWAEVGEGHLIGPKLVQETTDKILQIKDRLKVTHDRQKSYADKRRKPLVFSVGDYVLLKVSSWKGVKCLADPTLQVPLDEIRVDAKLNFMEEPVEILEREFKNLKRSGIAIIKIMPPRMRTRSAGRPTVESLGGGTGVWVGKGGRGRRPREGNDERVNDLNGQGNNQVPHLVTPENRKIERFMYGLAPQIRGMVAAIEPKTMQKAVLISGRENAGAWPKCTTCNSYHALGGPCRTCFNCNRPSHLAKGCRVDGNRVGCSYKEFLACNPKEYNGKGGVVVLTRWIKKMENQKLETELWNHAMVGDGHAAYTDRFYEFARLVPHLVTPENRKIERFAYGLAPQIRGMVAVIEPKTMQKAV
nr:hypothetical protein [Tanacetum cinerariifolium]